MKMARFYGLYQGKDRLVSIVGEREMVKLYPLFNDSINPQKSERNVPINFHRQLSIMEMRRELRRKKGKMCRVRLKKEDYIENIIVDHREILEDIATEEFLSGLPDKISY